MNIKIKKNLLNKCSIILCGDFNDRCNDNPVHQLFEKQF